MKTIHRNKEGGKKKAGFKTITAKSGNGFLSNLLKNVQQVSAATGIKPSDLLGQTKFGKSQTGSLGSLGLKSLGLGKKKRKQPRKKQGGKGFFSDLGNGFLSGITLGAYRPKGTENIGFLPFGKNGFATQAGIKPSDVAALTGNPATGVALRTIGQGKRGGSYGVRGRGANISSTTTTADRGAVYR